MNHAQTLHGTLIEMLDAPPRRTPSFDRLLHDYVGYHLVFVLVGGACAVALIGTSIALWRRARRARAAPPRERRVWRSLALATSVAGVLLVVVLAGNVSTVVSPRSGFASGAHLLATTVPARGRLDASYEQWIRSGTTRLPAGVHHAVEARLAWQRPKAAICAVALVLCALLTAGVWRGVLRRIRGGGRRTWPLAALGATGVLATLLLMAMTIGNAEAALDPISLTMLYG